MKLTRFRILGAVALAAALGAVTLMRSGGSAALAATPPVASPAARANVPGSRGKVVGASCNPADGYQPDWSKLEAKAEQQRKAMTAANARPLNLVEFVAADTPAPLERHQLPPRRLYCLSGDENPGGYLTSNCKTDADCPAPAQCDGSLCRAGCTADSDCSAPATCASISPGVKSCRYLGYIHAEQEVEAAERAQEPSPVRKVTTQGKKTKRGKPGNAGQ
jgi:hypothetical protein